MYGLTTQVESFWALHTHLAPPSLLTPTTDYLLFHTGISRPVWEDPLNITGGKWIIRLRKGVADRVWEALLCAVVGDMFAECRGASSLCIYYSGLLSSITMGTDCFFLDPQPRDSWEDEDGSDGEAGVSGVEGEGKAHEEDAPEICGCTISVRQSEDIVSLWNRVDQDVRVRERIRWVPCPFVVVHSYSRSLRHFIHCFIPSLSLPFDDLFASALFLCTVPF
jgi:translation initiation factor 4E